MRKREARMTEFPEQLPHGDIQEIFPDVFFVKGQSKYEANGNKLQITRSMTILRENDFLALVNSIRLSEDGLRALDDLGKVKDVIRIGSNHGRDDAFYSAKYDSAQQAQLVVAEHAARAPRKVQRDLGCRQRRASQRRDGGSIR